MKIGFFVLLAFLGALGICLFWFDGSLENRVEEARAVGKAQCEAEMRDARIGYEEQIKIKTIENIAYQRQLKEQRKGLNDDCKAIYDTDISICRQQLHRN